MSATPTLARRALAELVGTALLVATVVGSGVAAQRLSPRDTGLQLLENSLATGFVLVALVLALQPVSASFNPVVTGVERALGAIGTREAGGLVAAQVVGGAVGVVLAHLMFDLPAVTLGTRDRVTASSLLAEVVATLGLVLLVLATVRGGRPDRVAWVVGGWIAAAYWATSSTSFANPAVTLARALTDSFAGIAPASVLPFVAAQVLGGALGAVLAVALFPRPTATPRHDQEPSRATDA